MKVRGFNELALINAHPSSLLWKRRRDLYALGSYKSSETNMTSTKIHPTAIVYSNARLGPDVEIGPFSIIGPLVTIGEKTAVQSHVVIEGEVAIGRANLIGHGAIMNCFGAFRNWIRFPPHAEAKFTWSTRARTSRGQDRVLLIASRFSLGFCIRQSFPSLFPAVATIRASFALIEIESNSLEAVRGKSRC